MPQSSRPASEVDAIAERLYAVPPAEFVAARDEQVRLLRSQDRRGDATAVKGLRRPTQGAWLVNLLVRRRGDVVDQLLSLGTALREAEGALDPQALRTLSGQRRAVVDALVRSAAAMAVEAGFPAGADVRGEVQSTLEAGLLDPAAADELRRGRLTRALSRAGFGGGPTVDTARQSAAESGPRAVPRGGEQRASRRAEARREQALREAQEAVRDAEEAMRRADAERDSATAAARETADQLTTLTARLHELHERIADVERRRAEAALEARALAHRQERAEERAVAARRALERARKRLDEHLDRTPR